MTLEAAIASRELVADYPSVTVEELERLGIERREVTIPGHEGAELQASVFARKDHAGTGPGVYHVHGGGMVTGDRMVGIGQVMPWVAEHDAVLITVEYRLAPEFPHPYPVQDCYAGLVWFADHAADLGMDPERITVAGASAGGGIAAGITLMARDRKGPPVANQVLMCPMLDHRNVTVSARQYTDLGLWVTKSNEMGWSALLGGSGERGRVAPYASPSVAEDLSGLPPTFIDVGSAEVFRDEDVAFASALWAAGVDAELHVWAGGYHGFDMVVPDADVSRSAKAARDAWYARHLQR
jgi:acetyl esterase/lipase